MTDFKTVVRVLAEGGVDFIVVEGLAGPQDLEAIAELEALLEERRRGGA